MRKLEKFQILKNVGSSWFSLGINVLTGLFLSPFILHRLGDSAYGIWVLIFSVTGYYGLFDLGIRTSIVRYVSKFAATQETENLAKLINTSLFSYACIGVVSMLVTLVVCAFIDRLFRIPPEFHSTARWLFLMVGASVALGFPLGVFGGVLEVRAGRGNQGGVVTIRQLLLVIHYRHDGWVWRYSARQTTIKDFRNFDCVLGVNIDGHRYRGRRAGRNRSFEDRGSLISDCVSLGLLRTGECLRLQRACMAFICGPQARFPFGFASIAARALIFIVTKSEQKQFVFMCNEICA